MIQVQKFIQNYKSRLNQYPNEIPSYSELYWNKELIAQAFNTVEDNNLTNRHSELTTIENAQKKLNTKFLTDTLLLTVLEPCLMCTGAIILSRIHTVVYLLETKSGNGISSIEPSSIYMKNHFPKLIFYHEPELALFFKGFFKDKRN